MKFFKNIFSRIPINSLIEDALYDAELRLIEAQDGLEYAQAMVKYHTQQVKRLRERSCNAEVVGKTEKKYTEALNFPKLEDQGA